MTDAPDLYFANPAFREYIFLLVELERLFRHGEGQSTKADAIREEMDFPMHRYSTNELKALKEFGKHLTTMSEKYGGVLDQEPSEPPRAGNGVPAMPNSAHTSPARELSK